MAKADGHNITITNITSPPQAASLRARRRNHSLNVVRHRTKVGRQPFEEFALLLIGRQPANEVAILGFGE
jgi:hypothetical protein